MKEEQMREKKNKKWIAALDQLRIVTVIIL